MENAPQASAFAIFIELQVTEWTLEHSLNVSYQG